MIKGPKQALYISLAALTAGLTNSCTKELAKDAHPELVGIWYHRIDDEHTRTLTVVNTTDAKGTDSNTEYYRRWYWHDDKLYFGKDRKKMEANGMNVFHIDQYPAVTANGFILQKDTVAAGQTFMILDGNVYKQTN